MCVYVYIYKYTHSHTLIRRDREIHINGGSAAVNCG